MRGKGVYGLDGAGSAGNRGDCEDVQQDSVAATSPSVCGVHHRVTLTNSAMLETPIKIMSANRRFGIELTAVMTM
jgi:hypothetical protein